jgi:hypothetical protein
MKDLVNGIDGLGISGIGDQLANVESFPLFQLIIKKLIF